MLFSSTMTIHKVRIKYIDESIFPKTGDQSLGKVGSEINEKLRIGYEIGKFVTFYINTITFNTNFLL